MKKARFVVLFIAIAAGIGAVWLAGRIEPQKVVQEPASLPRIQTEDVLVASKNLDPGQKIQPSDLKWQAWPAEVVPSGYTSRASNANAVNELQGAFVRTSILAGEPIREDRLIKSNGSGYMTALIGAGMRGISTEISPENGVSGFVLPNDHVDVLLTRAEKVGPSKEVYVTNTILLDVRVLAIDQTVGEKSGQKVVVGKIATLELTPKQAERLALARRLGTISLALRGLSDQKTNDKNDHDLNDTSINIIRFGINTPTPIK